MPPRFTQLAAAMAREVVPARPFALRVARVPSINRSRVVEAGWPKAGLRAVLTLSFIRSYDSRDRARRGSVAREPGTTQGGAVRWSVASFLLALIASLALLLAPLGNEVESTADAPAASGQ